MRDETRQDLPVGGASGAAPAAPILVLGPRDVRRLLTVELALQSQREAFAALGARRAVLPPRLLLPGARQDTAFCYAARLSPDGPAVSKFGSVNPDNPSLGLPVVHAVIVVLDEGTGAPAAIVDGASVTEIRTSAASAVAAEALAPDIDCLAVIGAGVQGRAHVAAIAATHRPRRVLLWHPDREHADRTAHRWSIELGLDVAAAQSARSAVSEARLVVLATTSLRPVIERAWVEPGTTVISVGSFAPDRHEYDRSLLQDADLVVVDDLDAAREHAGPVAEALAEGTLSEDRVSTLGEILVGDAPGRSDDNQLIVYTSVGVGVQDAAAAAALLAAARRHGVDRVIELND